MTGNIALAGFVLTEDEWLALEPATREQLLVVAGRGHAGEAGALVPCGAGESARDHTAAHR